MFYFFESGSKLSIPERYVYNHGALSTVSVASNGVFSFCITCPSLRLLHHSTAGAQSSICWSLIVHTKDEQRTHERNECSTLEIVFSRRAGVLSSFFLAPTNSSMTFCLWVQ